MFYIYIYISDISTIQHRQNKCKFILLTLDPTFGLLFNTVLNKGKWKNLIYSMSFNIYPYMCNVNFKCTYKST